MAKRRSNEAGDDDLMARISSRAMVGPTIFWLIIWAICGFNEWVGLGLFFAWGGSVGLFHKAEKRKTTSPVTVDQRGYRPDQGGESDQSAIARQLGEAGATPIPTPLLHRQVIAEAAPYRSRLEAAAAVADGELGTRLRNMVGKAKAVEAGLEADRSRLPDVQRLFTYYLPATADLLAARGALAGTGEAQRLVEIDAMIGKLDLAYTDFAQRLNGHDARSLEIDLRLLDQALDAEFDTKIKV
jgi:hypothetical protein